MNFHLNIVPEVLFQVSLLYCICAPCVISHNYAIKHIHRAEAGVQGHTHLLRTHKDHGRYPAFSQSGHWDPFEMGLEECRGNQQAGIVTMGELSQKGALILRRFLVDRANVQRPRDGYVCGILNCYFE